MNNLNKYLLPFNLLFLLIISLMFLYIFELKSDINKMNESINLFSISNERRDSLQNALMSNITSTICNVNDSLSRVTKISATNNIETSEGYYDKNGHYRTNGDGLYYDKNGVYHDQNGLEIDADGNPNFEKVLNEMNRQSAGGGGR